MALTLDRADNLPMEQGPSTTFTGTTYLQRLAAAKDGSLGVLRVTFEKGARTFWHTHTNGQVLYFVEGRGRVQQRGEPAVDATVGDVVRIPPMAEHWHGAHPDEPDRMRHVAMSLGAVTWLDPVTEEDYRSGR